MPNILKGFLRPQVEVYAFPEADGLLPEPEAAPQQAQAAAPPDPAPAAQKPIDYARLQAEVILNEARKQAEDIQENAKDQLRAYLEEARQEGRSEGYRDGFAEGMAKAMAEGKLAREQQAAKEAADVGRFLEQVAWAREELMNQAESELRELALTIAEKVVRVSLKSSGEVVGRMIQGAVEKLKRRAWVHIYISGADAKSMAQIPPQLAAALSSVSEHVKIVPMADDESGTCIIEMPDEIIDASASTQLSNIRNILSDVSYRDTK